ncbi:HAMP domain-containing sensor histidine kinase [Oscillospiraceae bacterium PP1C4]
MNNKIAGKLIIYFASALLLFSIVIGCVFVSLFTSHTTKLHKNDLEKRAVNIAATLSGYMGGSSGHGQGGGYGAYMKFLDQIAMSDVWVVDKNSKLINCGQGHNTLTYGELPAGAETVIDEAFGGKISFSERFSELLGTNSITVGAPILGADGTAVGVVLLHSPIDGISMAVWDGLQTLGISMVVALVISGFIAVLFSLRFTKPLKRLNGTAALLAQGDYTVKTGVVQDDEIGELADTMDILSQRLYNASQESKKLEQMRQDFVSNISHELRTPVTVLRGSLEALCDGVVDDPAQVAEYHRQMLGESVHLQRLVNDLLDLSRLQNADFAIEMSPLNLCDIVEDVTRSMRKIAEQKQISIVFDSAVREYEIVGDYGRVRQMLMIVIDNAIKFSPKGKRVTISFTKNQAECILSIGDEGCGISEQELPHIFDRFHKASEGNPNGTGLGLAIAKQIADRHGIKVEVSSQPRVGTQICFVFSGKQVG